MSARPYPAPSRPLAPYAVSAIGILAVSTAAVLIRFAQGAGVPSLVIAAGRLSLASLVLLPIVLARDVSALRHLRRSDLGLAMLSGVFLAAHFASWIKSLEWTSVASSVVLVSTTPLWVALASAVLLRDPPGRGTAAGMLVALAGSLAVALGDACLRTGHLACLPEGPAGGALNLRGDLLAILGAWMASGYFLVGRALRARLALRPYVLLSYGTAALVLLLGLAISRTPVVGFAPQAVLWVVLLALVPQLIGHTSFNWALRYLSATFVTVATLGEPVGSVLLALVLLREIPNWLQVAGGVLILAGIAVASRAEVRRAG